MNPRPALIKQELLPQLVILTACIFLILGAIVLSPPETQSGAITLGPMSLPQVCTFKRITGLPCPGCGLTRSITAALHGNIPLSLKLHKLGLVTVLYILLQFLLSVMILAVPNWRNRLQKIGAFLNRGLIVLAVLFFINWIVHLVSLT